MINIYYDNFYSGNNNPTKLIQTSYIPKVFSESFRFDSLNDFFLEHLDFASSRKSGSKGGEYKLVKDSVKKT